MFYNTPTIRWSLLESARSRGVFSRKSSGPFACQPVQIRRRCQKHPHIPFTATIRLRCSGPDPPMIRMFTEEY